MPTRAHRRRATPLVALLAIALASTTTAAALPAQSAPSTPRPAPATLLVTGKGELRVRPNRAALTVGIEARTDSAATAVADMSRRTAAVLDTLRALGVADSLLVTLSSGVAPIHRTDPTTQQVRPLAVRAATTIRIEVPSLDEVGVYAMAVLAAGATTVQSPVYRHTALDSLRMVAARAAAAAARHEAMILATSLGGTLGALEAAQTAQGLDPSWPRGVSFDDPSHRAYYDYAGAGVAGAVAGGTAGVGQATAPDLVITMSVITRWRFAPTPARRANAP